MLLDKLQVLWRDRFYISMVFSFLSALAILSSYMMYASPKLEPDYDKKRAQDIAACKNFAQHKGFDVVLDGRSSLSVTSTRFDDPKFMFHAIETVILACRNLELKTACVGIEEHCSLEGVKMTFVYEKPDAY